MATNNPNPGTGEPGLTVAEAVDKVAGLLSDSNAATEELDSENLDETKTEEELAAELEAEGSDDVEGDGEDGEDSDDEGEAESEDEVAEHEASEDDDDDEGGESGYVELPNGDKINLDEIEDHVMRQADYTKKTQALSEKDASLNDERVSIATEREHLAVMIDAVLADGDDLPSLDELAELAETDPTRYHQVKAETEAKRDKREALKMERERLAKADNDNRVVELKKFVAKQQVILIEAIPELQKEETAKVFKSALTDYMLKVGYSKEELGGMFDSRAVIGMDKARRYDELMSKGKKSAKKARRIPKVVKPGRRKTGAVTKTKVRKKAVARARKSGSVKDAVDALLAG